MQASPGRAGHLSRAGRLFGKERATLVGRVMFSECPEKFESFMQKPNRLPVCVISSVAIRAHVM